MRARAAVCCVAAAAAVWQIGCAGSKGQGGAVIVSPSPSDTTVRKPPLPVWAGMKLVPGGTFQMGQESPDIGCAGCSSDEQPVHAVRVSSFWMDSTEVTQADYQALMGVNPARFTGDPRRPVEQVTWFDAALYCNKRSKRDGRDTVYRYASVRGRPGNGCPGLGGLAMDLASNGYRLPTEAQWEYACRAGTTGRYFWGEATDTATVGGCAWYSSNSGATTHTVATKLKNAFGLYDMSGNVCEWCNDRYSGYSGRAVTDPSRPASRMFRILRGGSWGGDEYALRSAVRYGVNPGGRYSYNGFRCVLPR